jgi:hypothetical protein
VSDRRGQVLVLHRAIINAGDFLIRDRTLALIARFRPDLPITVGRAWEPLREQFDADLIASARAIVICGGPGYQPGMYPRLYPLAPTSDLMMPIVLLALGTYAHRNPGGHGGLDEGSVGFLHRVIANGGRLGARDELTLRYLRGLGFPDVAMVGDPAWYDTSWLNRDDYGSLRTGVAFTPPANPLYHAQGLALLRQVAEAHGAGNVTVVFHRGSQRTFADACKRLGMRQLDIARRPEGFGVFDEVGCHIGYRVHAHLYCLGHATPSYLVAEDSRGLGVHETLGQLGADGMSADGRESGERAWRLMPRLGSQRSPLTRYIGLLASRAVRLPDVGRFLMEQVDHDRARDFPRHRDAKAAIRATLPAMVSMLEGIP